MSARPGPVRGRIFIYAQHLLGTGHLKRAALIARALTERGLQVELVSGGRPVAHLDFPVYQLPPAHCAPGDFSVLRDELDRAVDARWRSRRRQALIKHFVECQPDILIFEAFPFDRRQMRFELIPLLAAAEARRERPLIVASVRDVVHKRGAARIAETVDVLRRHFDQILVHGDPALIRFEESFAAADQIGDRLTYTGYVGQCPRSYRAERGADGPEVLVSAGGGAASRGLFMAALEARGRSRLRTARWRFLAGDAMSAADLDTLRSLADPGVVIERARADFPVLLARCAVSISQGGYNTVVDLLQARARSVIVPYVGDGETEQTLRARRLEQLGYACVVDEHRLTAAALAMAVDRAAAMQVPAVTIDLDGAARSADHLIDALRSGRRARRSS